VRDFRDDVGSDVGYGLGSRRVNERRLAVHFHYSSGCSHLEFEVELGKMSHGDVDSIALQLRKALRGDNEAVRARGQIDEVIVATSIGLLRLRTDQ
jgi:hypothetical protein